MSNTISMESHQDIVEGLEKEISELQQDKNDIYEDYEELKTQYSELVDTSNNVLRRDIKDINELKETIRNLECDLKKKDENSLLKDKQLEAKDRLIKHLEEKLEAEDDEQLQYTQTLLNMIDNLTNLVKEYRITVGVLIVVILFQIMLMVTL